MKQAIYKYGQILALLAVLALFAFYIKDNPAVFRQVFALKPGGLALIASLTLLNITVNAYLAKSLLKFLGFRADLLLVFKINALGLMLNLILIKGGTLAKAYYLREFIGLTMKKYLALIALSALV